ncbi:MAG: type II toxin-antitoxin system RelE/ParE family toxin [Hyphomicrobiales bacterium]|nr:type II toxin-antitoxin system RelE/ParE family toxin [Hyphomicrobiales bacterium]
MFSAWHQGLRDPVAKAKIAARIDRLTLGNPGDVEPIGEGLSELRIAYGPGYRVYFVRRGRVLVILLCGGQKARRIATLSGPRRLRESSRSDNACRHRAL